MLKLDELPVLVPLFPALQIILSPHLFGLSAGGSNGFGIVPSSDIDGGTNGGLVISPYGIDGGINGFGITDGLFTSAVISLIPVAIV